MTLTELIVTYTITFIVAGIVLFFLLSKFNMLQRYALFLAAFVTVCMITSLFYIKPTVLAPELNIIPPQPAKVIGFPLCIDSVGLGGIPSPDPCGWKGKNAIVDMAFYLLGGLIIIGVYTFTKNTFMKGHNKP